MKPVHCYEMNISRANPLAFRLLTRRSPTTDLYVQSFFFCVTFFYFIQHSESIWLFICATHFSWLDRVHGTLLFRASLRYGVCFKREGREFFIDTRQIRQAQSNCPGKLVLARGQSHCTPIRGVNQNTFFPALEVSMTKKSYSQTITEVNRRKKWMTKSVHVDN